MKTIQKQIVEFHWQRHVVEGAIEVTAIVSCIITGTSKAIFVP
jgi:hypothetical protein